MRSSWAADLVVQYGDPAAAVVRQVDDQVDGLANPDAVRVSVRRFLETGGNPQTNLRSFLADPAALELFLHLCAASQFGAEICHRHPGVFWDLIQQHGYRQILGRRLLMTQLRERLDILRTVTARQRELIRFQHGHLLRLMMGDLAGVLSFEALTGELSDLADVLIDAALSLACVCVSERLGPAPGDFAVIALGKLGARELNYSSDIDLIFLYRTAERSTDAAHGWMRRLGTELIRILDDHHEEGRLYRVDMRLRPEGAAGELVHSIEQAQNYYYSVGRPWERQALIKARCCAGTIALGAGFLQELVPWIYPQSQSIADVREARLMRRRIEERSDHSDLKAGSGGIRDIEFLVQSYQLHYGGRDPELRSRATLPALRRLVDAGLLTPEEGRELEQGYVWLRLVEHRLQMWEARQLHDLPIVDEDRHDLALRCGITGVDALRRFDDELERIRGRVRELSAEHYLERGAEEDTLLLILTADVPDPALAVTTLEPYGIRDVPRAITLLREMATERFFVLSRNRTIQHLLLLLPQLLERCATSPDPDRTLANFNRIVEAVGGRSRFYGMLLRKPKGLDLVIDLAGWANFPMTYLTRYPGLPDECLERLRYDPADSEALRQEAQGLIHGVDDFLPQLAYLQARELVGIAIRDLQGTPGDRISGFLSGVARCMVQTVLDRCTADVARRWGLPVRPDGAPARCAILGLGKLGSGELTYASDMDVIFVCDPDGTCPNGSHDGIAFWTRVAQRLIQGCENGRLYQVDPRLRPWGGQSQLVVTTRTLDGYWSESRDLWERMAMTRVSPIAGNADLGRQAVDGILAGAFRRPLPDDTTQQVRQMRWRLEESVSGEDNVKRGYGGYVDIEFLAHLASLRHLDPTSVAGLGIDPILARLTAIGQMDVETGANLRRCLGILRRIESRARLYDGHAISLLPKDPIQRAVLARCSGYPDLAAMDLELHLTRETVRMLFDRLIRE